VSFGRFTFALLLASLPAAYAADGGHGAADHDKVVIEETGKRDTSMDELIKNLETIQAQERRQGRSSPQIDLALENLNAGNIKPEQIPIVQSVFGANTAEVNGDNAVELKNNSLDESSRNTGVVLSDDQKEEIKKSAIASREVIGSTESTGTRVEPTLFGPATTEVSSQKSVTAFNAPVSKAVLVASVVNALNNSQSASTPFTNDIKSGPSQDTLLASTQGEVSAASGSSTPGTSRSADEISVDTSQFTLRARELLSIPRSGNFDLLENPFYQPASSLEIRSALQRVALDGAGPQGAKKLVTLATQPGFQEMIGRSLGPEQQKDFNLLTAGAALAGDEKISKESMAFAKAYINQGLSSTSLIEASPELSALSQSLGGEGLAGLSPQTLEWLALASKLAFESKASSKDDFRKGYTELQDFIRRLKSGQALNLLDELRFPYEKAQALRGWDNAHQKWAASHADAIADLRRLGERAKPDERDLLKRLGHLHPWVLRVPRDSVRSSDEWFGIVENESNRVARLWAKLHPLSLERAKFYAARARFYGSMSQFQEESPSSMAMLVREAQVWAKKVENERRLEMQKLRMARRSKGRAPSKVSQNFMREP
jgi:hypothetical protein